MNRREFLMSTLAAGAAFGQTAPAPKADSVIFIWLPGGVAQTDTWDPKKHTPFTPGMKGSELLGTCPGIPTKVDGLSLGQGLENMASVMDRATLIRSLVSQTKFGAIHLKAQYYANTGYLFPAGVKVPSTGAVVSRVLGRKNPNVPGYIYIGRDIDSSDEEKLFISEYLGTGILRRQLCALYDSRSGQRPLDLNAVSGMKLDRLDRRQEYLKTITGLEQKQLITANKAGDYMKVMDDARAMMDSPVKKSFDYLKEEKPETVKAYEPDITSDQLLDRTYYNGNRFGHGLLLARRLVEAGARYIQVEYQYGPFKGFDMHENGQKRMTEMKRQIDKPIAQLIRDLEQRGLLDRTLVVIASEFGRTVASSARGRQRTRRLRRTPQRQRINY